MQQLESHQVSRLVGERSNPLSAKIDPDQSHEYHDSASITADQHVPNAPETAPKRAERHLTRYREPRRFPGTEDLQPAERGNADLGPVAHSEQLERAAALDGWPFGPPGLDSGRAPDPPRVLLRLPVVERQSALDCAVSKPDYGRPEKSRPEDCCGIGLAVGAGTGKGTLPGQCPLHPELASRN